MERKMHKPLHFLLIEDSESDEILIVRELRKRGYEPVYERIENAESMIDALGKQDWDIVISDYILPEFSGLDALKLLRKNAPDIPCIIISGQIDDETAVSAMKAGAKDYIMKNNLKRLSVAVERELHEAQTRKERREVKEELQRNEAKLSLLLEQMPCILWTADTQMKITSLIGAGLASIEANPAQLIGESIPGKNPPFAANQNALKAHYAALSGTPVSYEWELPERESTYYSYVEPQRDIKGSIIGIIGIALDTTERKKSDETQRRLASIVESSNDAIISANTAGIITSWNKSAERIYGYAENEILGKPVTILDGQGDNNNISLNMDKLLAEEQIINFETAHKLKNGETVNVALTVSPIENVFGEVTGISTIARDISIQKAMERRIILGNEVMKLFWEVSSKKEYLECALNLIYQWCGCDCAGIRVVVPEKQIIPYLAYKGFGDEFIKMESELLIGKDMCACTRVISGSPEVQDMSALTPEGSFYLFNSQDFINQLNQQQLARFRGRCIQCGFQTIIIVPIRHRESILGAIHITDKKPSAISLKEVEILESISEIIGQGIYRFDIEEKMRNSEKRLAEAQHSAHLGNWEWHILSNKLFLSDEVYRIFGICPHECEVNFDTFLTCVHDADKDMVRRLMTEEALSGKKSFNLDYRIVLNDDSLHYIHGQFETVYGENQKPVQMIGTVQDVTQMKQIEEELRALSRRLVKTQENERRTIARELHDEIGQSLTALKMLLDQAERLPVKRSRNSINEAKMVIGDLMKQVREMSLNLRPSMLDDLGLLPTLIWHFEKYSAQTGIQIKFHHDGLRAVQKELDTEINTTVYRIVQEALTNIARHAKVDSAEVSICCDKDNLLLRIEDAGHGFALSKLKAASSTGLSGMRERVKLLNGKITLDSASEQGTRILVELPINRSGNG